MSPTDGNPIFNSTTGAILEPTLLGWEDTSSTPQFKAVCQGPPGPGPRCSAKWPPTLIAWRYIPGTTSGGTPSFPPPTQALPNCSGGGLSAYQETIAGCVTTPIACNSTVTLDSSDYNHRNRQTADAVNCLTHADNDQGDQVKVAPPNQSFEFLAGVDNPIPGVAGKNVLVSDSLVTVPVFDGPISVSNTAQVIGFVQLFMNWDGNHTNPVPPGNSIKTAIVNLVGCGTSATGTPIYGNGPSAVAVRLIHP